VAALSGIVPNLSAMALESKTPVDLAFAPLARRDSEHRITSKSLCSDKRTKEVRISLRTAGWETLPDEPGFNELAFVTVSPNQQGGFSTALRIPPFIRDNSYLLVAHCLSKEGLLVRVSSEKFLAFQSSLKVAGGRQTAKQIDLQDPLVTRICQSELETARKSSKRFCGPDITAVARIFSGEPSRQSWYFSYLSQAETVFAVSGMTRSEATRLVFETPGLPPSIGFALELSRSHPLGSNQLTEQLLGAQTYWRCLLSPEPLSANNPCDGLPKQFRIYFPETDDLRPKWFSAEVVRLVRLPPKP
jgi:hypothetical protein